MPAAVTNRPAAFQGDRARLRAERERQEWKAEPLTKQDRHAEEARLRSELRSARDLGDEVREREAATQLARWLWRHERGLREAAALAIRALDILDDPELRAELSVGLEALGEPLRAANELRETLVTVDDEERAKAILLRLTRLCARSQDADAALVALKEAEKLDPHDPRIFEVRLDVSAWSGAKRSDIAVASLACAQAWLAREDEAGALRAALRALHVDAGCTAALDIAVPLLLARGEAPLARELGRRHAQRGGHQVDRAFFETECQEALAAGEPWRALAAALTLQQDAATDSVAAASFDDLLRALSLFEPLAVRLEMRAEATEGRERAQLLVEVGAIWAGELANESRARICYARALALDPGSYEAAAALRAMSEREEQHASFAEALVQAMLSGQGSPSERLTCARELGVLAEERLQNPALAAWAYERVLTDDPSDIVAQVTLQRLKALRDEQERQVVEVIASLEQASGEGRADVLHSLVHLLEGFPDRTDELLLAIEELIEVFPDDQSLYDKAIRVARRRKDMAALLQLARTRLEGAQEFSESLGAHETISAAEAAFGTLARACDVLEPLALSAQSGAHLASALWVRAAATSDARSRARALGMLSKHHKGPLRTALGVFAAEALFAQGDAAEARKLLTALPRDLNDPHLTWLQAEVLADEPDELGMAALERCIEWLGDIAPWCMTLAHATVGATAYAWAVRALRAAPADEAALVLWAHHVGAADSAENVATMVETVLAASGPWSRNGACADAFSRALRACLARDVDVAVTLAKTLLDALGPPPSDSNLREAIVDAAGAATGHALSAILLERFVDGDQTQDLALAFPLADAAEATGDFDRAARALVRAASHPSLLPEAVLRAERLEGIVQSLDARLAVAEVLATPETDDESSWNRIRRWGAAQWSYAADETGAVESWYRASTMGAPHTVDVFAGDLERFGGARFAAGRLEAFAAKEPRTPIRIALTIAAASLAMAANEPVRAFELVLGAFDLGPVGAEAVEVAERAAVSTQRLRELSSIYDRLGDQAFGRFGARAAHHRGARFFEQIGEVQLAFRHAHYAFAAVPSTGTSLTMLLRIADQAGNTERAAAVLAEVAEACDAPGEKLRWLRRAAEIPGETDVAFRRRVELYLQALALSPDARLVPALFETTARLTEFHPDEREALGTRIRQVGATMTDQVDGPEGARLLVAWADMQLRLFDDAEESLRLVEKALAIDGDIDEFGKLSPLVTKMSLGPSSRDTVTRCLALAARPYANVGAQALLLLAALSHEIGDEESSLRALVLAGERNPEDDLAVARATLSLERLEDTALRDRFEKRISPARRAEALDNTKLAPPKPVELPPASVPEPDVIVPVDYTQVAEELAARATELAGSPDNAGELRAVRLRRAAILEQRLGRSEEARAELERLLTEAPDNEAGLSYLADLHLRAGAADAAASTLRRLADKTKDASRRADVELRLARALFQARRFEQALSSVRALLVLLPGSEEGMRLRAAIARETGDDVELGEALDELAARIGDEAQERSDWLLEGAQAAARLGDLSLALGRAERAARLAPSQSSVHLFAKALEYRVRGVGTPQEARATLDVLLRVESGLGPEDAALLAFLRAEALDAVEGNDAALRVLTEEYDRLGPLPLLALGLGERYLVRQRPRDAAHLLGHALGGALLGMRKRGRVALAAADAAEKAGDIELSKRFLAIASADPDTQGHVAKRAERRASATVRAATPVSEPVKAGEPRGPGDMERAIVSATTPEERNQARVRLAAYLSQQGQWDLAEDLASQALADGSLEAASFLDDAYATRREHIADLVRVRRQAVELAPGDLTRLERLHAAALADQHLAYARSLEHVLRAFDRQAPALPPPLAHQSEQPGMLTLLMRHSREPAGEAMALLWEGASSVFARSVTSYALTGLERVVPGPFSALSRLYEIAIRLLDMPRIPLFVRRKLGALSPSVALLSPVSAVLHGDAREETTELHFVLGQALSAAFPENALLLGLNDQDARVAWQALIGGFGPPEMAQILDPRSRHLAETLWQTLGHRAQRRMNELMQTSAAPDYDLLMERAHQSGRRLGMFLAGDFGYAARALIGEYPELDVEALAVPGGLAHLCGELPSLADLYRLAVRPEYADARFRHNPAISTRNLKTSVQAG